MIALANSEGDISVCGSLREWIEFLRELDLSKLDENAPGDAHVYLLNRAARANKFRRTGAN